MRHFGDDISSQVIDWCKKLVPQPNAFKW